MPTRYGLYFKTPTGYTLKIYEISTGPVDKLIYKQEFKTKKQLDKYCANKSYSVREIKR